MSGGGRRPKTAKDAAALGHGVLQMFSVVLGSAMTTTCAAPHRHAVAAVALGGAFALRTEVTKLTSEFSVEAVFEADLDNVARCVS